MTLATKLGGPDGIGIGVGVAKVGIPCSMKCSVHDADL